MLGPPRLVCVPSTDLTLAAEARRVASRIPAGVSSGEALAWFARELRRTYPTAVVRPQDELARVPGDVPVWYVTRRDRQFRIDTSVWVPLAPEDAYRLYVERVPEWQTAVSLKLRRATPDLVGTEYHATYEFLGRHYAGAFRVLAADPGRSVSFEAKGSGITVWYVTSFRPEHGGTRVAVQGDYDLPDTLLARVADRLGIERAIARDIARANETYREMCLREASSQDPGE